MHLDPGAGGRRGTKKIKETGSAEGRGVMMVDEEGQWTLSFWTLPPPLPEEIKS